MISILKKSVFVKTLLTAALPVMLIAMAAGCEDGGPVTVLFTSDTQGRLVPSG